MARSLPTNGTSATSTRRCTPGRRFFSIAWSKERAEPAGERMARVDVPRNAILHGLLAEREVFEPWVPLPVRQMSNRPPVSQDGTVAIENEWIRAAIHPFCRRECFFEFVGKKPHVQLWSHQFHSSFLPPCALDTSLEAAPIRPESVNGSLAPRAARRARCRTLPAGSTQTTSLRAKFSSVRSTFAGSNVAGPRTMRCAPAARYSSIIRR
jgi:hypothetical protein